ncbi:uncharacterized protein LOC143206489 [Rhynchophorus ferrugineus]|uniref:uncharacterized protein LOC143206489 n=1 Tax=Rhynchophorus ferrugineus TaxID=354439 RepID=UPI003FCDC89F
MHPIFNDIKRNFMVFCTVLLTVITTKVRALQCSSDEMMRCSKPLAVLDTGFSFVSTKADLDKICPDLKQAIRCIHQYTRFCMEKNDRTHFKKLFHGTAEMVNHLCRNGTFQEEYLRHAPCMQIVDPQNEVCFKKYTKNMSEIQAKTPIDAIPESDVMAYRSLQKRKRDAADEGIKNVCCAFQEYVECSTSTTEQICGAEAADFSRKFLDKMSSSMKQLHCQNYGPRECGLLSSSSPSYQTSVLSLVGIGLFAIVLR